MFTHQIFTIVTNTLGLNFYEQKVPLTLVFFLHLVANILNLINIYFAFIISNPKMKGVYVCIDCVQLIIPLAIKNFIMVRAINLRHSDEKFNNMTGNVYAASQVDRNKRKYLLNLVICFIICAVKTSMVLNKANIVYNSAQVIATLINAASDFLFVFHVQCLTEHFKQVRTSSCDVRKEVLRAIEIKRLIHLRYSPNLMLAITIYFLLIIFSLYWIFVRIVFGSFNGLDGKIILNSNKNNTKTSF